MISSLPGKALRTLVDSTCVLEAEPGKLDIKRHEPEASSTMRALSTALRTVARLYLDLCVLGDDAWIS